MKRANLIAILLLALSAACADRSSSGSQISENKPSSTDYRSAANTSSTSSAAPSSADKLTGGGGGGGSRSQNAPIAQKISLDQTADTRNAPTAIDRKIIRNADLSLEAESPETSQQKLSLIHI